MNPLKGFLSLFQKKPTASTEANERWLRGYEAFEAGKKHFAARRDKEAVSCFDTAVECGFEDAILFGLRGSCLQSLGWDFDAIDDFTKAISLDQQDCNTYFQRAMSKTSVGDEEGFLADMKDAIRLSKADTALNREYTRGANQQGWKSIAAMYEGQVALSGDCPDFIKKRKIERAQLRGRRKDKPSDNG